MIKYFLTLLLSLFLLGCSYGGIKNITANKKAFEQEDSYILYALRAEQVGENKIASKLFVSLYEKSLKKEYLYRSLENDLIAKEYKSVIKRVKLLTEDAKFDAKLERFKIIALMAQNKLDKAIALSIALSAKTKKANDYLLASEIYIKLQKFDMAVRYLEGAYVKEYNEKILDKMSIILYVNLGRKKDAIAELETHSRVFACSKLICNRLVSFYSNDNNVNGLLSTYLRLYAFEKSKRVANKIVKIYSYKRDYIGLMSFLEKYNIDDALLLELYSSLKNYKKAYILSDKLYKETADIEYLGQSAIFEYESTQGTKTKKFLHKIIKKLTYVADQSKKPLYLNYLGYILIDHDIDVKKGMSYIHDVLTLRPDSSYYLDSLAWGYYKLGECQKAKKIMQRVVTLEGGKNPEVMVHVRKINKCLKN